MDSDIFYTIGALIGAGALITGAMMIKQKAFIESELKSLKTILSSEIRRLSLDEGKKGLVQEMTRTLEQLTLIEYRPFSLFPPEHAEDLIETCRQYGIRPTEHERYLYPPTGGF